MAAPISTFRPCGDGFIVGVLTDERGQSAPVRLRADVANEMTRNMLRAAPAASAC